MPPRKLVWTKGALKQFVEFLGRRNDKGAVRKCVEQHLLTVADNVEGVARKWTGPSEGVWLYRFQCKDGQTVLYIQAELEATDDSILGVLGCGTVAF